MRVRLCDLQAARRSSRIGQVPCPVLVHLQASAAWAANETRTSFIHGCQSLVVDCCLQCYLQCPARVRQTSISLGFWQGLSDGNKAAVDDRN